MTMEGIFISCVSGFFFALGSNYMRLASKSRERRLGPLKFTPEGKMIMRGPTDDYERNKILLGVLYLIIAACSLLGEIIRLR